MEEVIQKFGQVLAKRGYTFIFKVVKDRQCSTGLCGSPKALREALHEDFQAVAKNEANPAQAEFVEAILDVVSINYSPNQLKKMASERAGRILPKI